MKRLLCIVSLGMVMCLLSACGKKQTSPQIVCDLGGEIVPTAFTFDEFKQTLATEHGQVEATGHDQIKSRSLVVFFKPLENNRVLAERAILLKTGAPIPAAVLFGLTNAIAAPLQAAPAEASSSNVPAVAPASN